MKKAIFLTTIALTFFLSKIGFGQFIQSTPTQNTGNLSHMGNLGIGIITPQKKLHLYSQNTSGYGTGLRLEYSYTGPINGCSAGSIWDLTADCNKFLNISTPFISIPVITLDGNNGKVGIGINLPNEKLEVAGIGRFSSTNGYTNIGFNGLNGHIDNYSTNPASALILNWYSGKDVKVGGPATGNFVTNHNTYLSIVDGKTIIGGASDCSISNLKLIVDGQVFLTDGPTEEPRTIFWGYNCKPEWGLEYDAPGVMNTKGGLNFWNPYTSSSGLVNCRMFLENKTGNVGIGTCSPKYKLDVCGTIRSKEWIVENFSCADFVFDEKYNRPSYIEKEIFFKENKHLKGVQSEKEIENDGLKVSQALSGLVQNLEENSLDIIDLYKIIEQQKKEIDILIEEIKYLKNK